MFWQVEGHTGLYVLFKTVCDTYDLLPAENYKLPPEAEGLEIIDEPKAKVPSIMKSDENNNLSAVDEDFINVGRANTNTRRHVRSSPSVGSAIHTVLESDEEDPDITHKLEELNLADEEGAADVPVIVESHEVEGQHDTPEEKPKPELEPVEEVEQLAAEHDDTAASAGSWDRMSSESLGEKLPTENGAKVDASEKTEEVKTDEVSAPELAKSPEEMAEDVPATEEVPETVKDSDVKEEPQEEAAEAKEEAEAKKVDE